MNKKKCMIIVLLLLSTGIFAYDTIDSFLGINFYEKREKAEKLMMERPKTFLITKFEDSTKYSSTFADLECDATLCFEQNVFVNGFIVITTNEQNALNWIFEFSQIFIKKYGEINDYGEMNGVFGKELIYCWKDNKNAEIVCEKRPVILMKTKEGWNDNWGVFIRYYSTQYINKRNGETEEKRKQIEKDF